MQINHTSHADKSRHLDGLRNVNAWGVVLTRNGRKNFECILSMFLSSVNYRHCSINTTSISIASMIGSPSNHAADTLERSCKKKKKKKRSGQETHANSRWKGKLCNIGHSQETSQELDKKYLMSKTKLPPDSFMVKIHEPLPLWEIPIFSDKILMWWSKHHASSERQQHMMFVRLFFLIEVATTLQQKSMEPQSVPLQRAP